jgi:hypothetical protein
MSTVDDLLKQRAELDVKLKEALAAEREAELKLIKEKIELFGFKAIDFKSCWQTRKKRAPKSKETNSTMS